MDRLLKLVFLLICSADVTTTSNTTTTTTTCHNFQVVQVTRKYNKVTTFYSIRILKHVLEQNKGIFTLRISNNQNIEITSKKAVLKSVQDDVYAFFVLIKKEKPRKENHTNTRNRQSRFTPYLSILIKLQYPIFVKKSPRILHFTVGSKFGCRVPQLKHPKAKECKTLRQSDCSKILKKSEGGYFLHLENVTQLNMFVLKLHFAHNVTGVNISREQSVGVREVLSLKLCGWSYYFLIMRSDLKPLRLFFTTNNLPEVKYIYYGDYFCNSECGKKNEC